MEVKRVRGEGTKCSLRQQAVGVAREQIVLRGIQFSGLYQFHGKIGAVVPPYGPVSYPFEPGIENDVG